MTDGQIPTEVLEAATRDAARAYCLTRYTYTPAAYVNPEARDRHIEYDIASTAEEDWLTVVLAAAAPHLIAEGRRQRDQELFVGAIEPDGPVEDETPALMARVGRLVRAKVAAEIRDAHGRDRSGGAWGPVYRDGLAEAARIAEGSTDAR